MGNWYVRSLQSLSKHRKTMTATALLRTDRHKLIGHLHELWWWGLDNADIHGVIGPAPDEVIAEAAGWPVKDAKRFVGALLAVGFIERSADGTLVLHDWYEYAGKLNEKREKDADRKRKSIGTPAEIHRNSTLFPSELHTISIGDPTESHTDSTGVPHAPNLTLNNRSNPPPSPLGDGRAVRPVPKPKKPGRVPITEQDVEDLVRKYAERYGSPQAVRDEIEQALNHVAAEKRKNERLYVDGWLRREFERRPTFIRGAPSQQSPPRRSVDHTGCPAGCTETHPERA